MYTIYIEMYLTRILDPWPRSPRIWPWLGPLPRKERSFKYDLGSFASNYTVINFRPKLQKFLRFPLNRKLLAWFRMIFAKTEVSVAQNHTQNSGPKFRLLIPDWIREKIDSDFWSPGRFLIFCSSFLVCLGVEPRTFWAQSQQRRPTNQAANWIGQKNDNAWNIPSGITKSRIRFINFTKNETSGVLRLIRMFRGFYQKLQLNYQKFRLIFQKRMLR
jgi:hypothetical protein